MAIHPVSEDKNSSAPWKETLPYRLARAGLNWQGLLGRAFLVSGIMFLLNGHLDSTPILGHQDWGRFLAPALVIVGLFFLYLGARAVMRLERGLTRNGGDS